MDATQIARHVADALARADFDAATERFDPQMKRKLPPEQLAAGWQQMTAANGGFVRFGEPTSEPSSPGTLVSIPIEMARTTWMLRVGVRDGLVGGLFLQPAPPAVEHPIPRYLDAGSFTEHPVTVGADGWPLPGTLTLPRTRKGLRRKVQPPYPGVVFVHGSGPSDRDATVGGSKIFFDLAMGLAARGIASLRHEKRTLEHRARAAEMAVTLEEEVIDDALAAVAALRAHAEVDRVFVLGHSLGGRIAPSLAARDPSIGGLIVAAGSARPLEVALVEQLRHLVAHASDEHRPVVAEQLALAEEQAGRVAALTPRSRIEPAALPFGAPVSYWLSLREHDPATTAPTVRQPMLILHGGRDYQVTEDDLAIWEKATASLADVTVKRYPALNHLLAAGSGPSTPDEYQEPATVDKRIVDDVADWVRAR